MARLVMHASTSTADLSSTPAAFEQAVRRVASVAGAAADDVDRTGRFPHESLAALKEQRLLGALVPRELGGMGLNVADVSFAVRILASECATSAMVLAMHSIDVGNLARHGVTEPLRELQREIASSQLLCANANSEVGLGGDAARSLCAIEPSGAGATLTKEALAISYGEYADIIFATARKTPESDGGDQVQAICRGWSQLEPLSDWDSMGLRGTCSRSFRLVADIDPGLVYPVPFSVIVSTGGMHTTLLLTTSVWIGIAESAAARAHAFVRAAARKAIGTVPGSAMRLAQLSANLDQLRALLSSTSQRVLDADRAGALDDQELLAALRNLKLASSEGAVNIARTALEICGIAGYRRDTKFSLDRLLRDACAGLVMVGNERVLRANAEMLLVRKQI